MKFMHPNKQGTVFGLRQANSTKVVYRKQRVAYTVALLLPVYLGNAAETAAKPGSIAAKSVVVDAQKVRNAPKVVEKRPAVSELVDGVIAKVNDQEILYSDLMQAVQQVCSAEKTKTDTPKLRRTVLQQLVERQIALTNAKAIPRLEQEVHRRREQALQRLRREVGTDAQIEAAFRRPLYEIREKMTKNFREELIVQRTRQQVVGNVRVTPQEVRSFFKKMKKKERKQLPATWVVEEVRYRPQVDTIQNKALLEELNDLKQRIEQGEDFVQLAQTHADDVSSSQPAAALPFVEKGDLLLAYEEAALQLKPGQVSAPIALAEGFALIQLLAVAGDRYKSRYLLRIPTAAQQQAATQVTFEHLLRAAQQRTLAVAVSESPAQQVLQHRYLTTEEGEKKLTREELPEAVAAAVLKLSVGTATAPMPYTTEEGEKTQRILFLTSQQPAHRLNLVQDYDQIKAMAVKAKKDKALAQWLTAEKQKANVYIHSDYR